MNNPFIYTFCKKNKYIIDKRNGYNYLYLNPASLICQVPNTAKLPTFQQGVGC